ncbi:unnamed protein product [Caenorhabditis sp. 36 PRJEB53466]|nr:unnamed protein product [Caenorhabditis sp. 36 PRJEB53466]
MAEMAMKGWYEVRGKDFYIWEGVLAMYSPRPDSIQLFKVMGGEIFEIYANMPGIEISNLKSDDVDHALKILKVLPSAIVDISIRLDPNPLRNWITMKKVLLRSIAFLSTLANIVEPVTVGKLLQVPDKDPTLKALVYKEGLPIANRKIHDTVMWVPATTQFSARRITVINQGRPYSTWTYDLLLQQSDCPSRSTPIADLPGCKPMSSSPKTLCTVYTSLFDNDFSSAESEVYCSKS